MCGYTCPMSEALKSEVHMRPTWDEYFLQMADLVGMRGTCDRGYVGCVITRDRRILATGYAGSPMGLPHCDEVGHEMHTVTNEDGTTSRHCIRTTHSETNAIANAARFGVAIDGGTIYVKMVPCYTCAKIIINAGIKRVVCVKDYHAADRTKDIFKQAQVELVIIKNEVENYKDQ